MTLPVRGIPAAASILGSKMDAFIVRGGRPLTGSVRASGAKNSALKLVAAALLTPGHFAIRNVPDIADMRVMAAVLEHLGVAVQRDGETLTLDVPDAVGDSTPPHLVSKLRASIVVLGPLLARRGHVRVATPGGCNLGNRAIDMHLSGLARMGAEISYGADFVEARTQRLRGAAIELPYASVGATENLLMAAVTAEGTTTVGNAAREPEIVDLARFLRSMGADISGEGTDEIIVTGVRDLGATEHAVVGDRIEAGTFAVAAAVTGGQIDITGVDPAHLRLVIDKLRAVGATVDERDNGMTVTRTGDLRPVDVVTLPFPGFPTDLQPQFLLLLSQANGTSMLTENVFDGRFSIIDELNRLGADITLEGHHAVVRGPRALRGAEVRATDLRAGAALVLAGLVADGETVVAEP
ncbi:MAG: UDP-N-acetylglucosamine 1-carboxyvinyltransferase, partial [Nitriliruptorales bacterium]|nr:UDP-N-acetylglucosamine 1-carboxyvinyltransferase [Nitriliruptorales bacterium]